jgi:hypothetical protein
VKGADVEPQGLVVYAQVVVTGEGSEVLLEVLLGEIQKLGHIGLIVGQLADGVQVVKGEQHKLLVQAEPVVSEDAMLEAVRQREGGIEGF